jgi:hypothetical protein
MTSKKTFCYPKGTPISLFKPRWHGFLLMMKQFITCEGRYGLVFLYHVRFLIVFLRFKLNASFYLHKIFLKMAKFYHRNKLNPWSSLFHHGLIRILMVSHLSKTGDSWGNFLFRNNFTLPKNEIKSLLHLNENPSPCQSNPTIENLSVNLQEDHASTDQTFVVIQKPSGKKPRCDFIPKKSLE